MNILILHRIRHSLMRYDEAIDHRLHDVYYVGDRESLANIPPALKCRRLVRSADEPIYECAIEWIKRLGVRFGRVISLAEADLMDAARIAEVLGIPGRTPAQVEAVRDKVVMKRRVAEAGIAVPQFVRLDEWVGGARLPIGADAEVILKPVDGATARDVQRIASQQTLERMMDRSATGIAALDQCQASYAGFEVEEFVDGDILHIDGFVQQGRVRAMTAGRYLNTLLDYAHGIPVGSVQIDLTEARKRWVASVLQALEIDRGAFHLEVIESARGPVFLEIAHRAGGARICKTFELQTGVYLPVAVLADSIDPDFRPKITVDRKYSYAWFIVPGHHLQSTYCQVSGHRWLRRCPELMALEQLPIDVPLKPWVSYKEDELPLAGQLRSVDADKLENLIKRLFARLQLKGCNGRVTAGHSTHPADESGTLTGGSGPRPESPRWTMRNGAKPQPPAAAAAEPIELPS